MSDYDNDPRVRLEESGIYYVDLLEVPGRPDDGYVAPRPDGHFEASVGWSDMTRLVYYTADDAIRSLIGDPQ